jgi:uncharacterized protein (TIGR02996 family)
VERDFLKRVTDEPDDTTARLVFADWLREQDDAARTERGEFIHVQHALADGRPTGEARAALRARQAELLDRYREGWDAPFRDLVKGCEYRLGFAERVTLSVEQFVDGFAHLVERTPVVRVRLSGLTPDTVGFVAEVPALGRLAELDFNRQPVSPGVLRDLLASPHVGRLRYLNLARTGVGDAGVRALVGSPVFRRLRYLNLAHADVGPAGVSALLGAIYTRSSALEVLVLRGAPRVAPGTFAPLPHGLPLRVRQSLGSQLGLDPGLPGDLLTQLHANRETQSGEVLKWVDLLRTRGAADLPRLVASHPLPDPVRGAFTRACERRVLWRVKRLGLGSNPSALPIRERRLAQAARDLETKPPAGTVEHLAEIVRLLVSAVDAGTEARALAACLLELYLRYERGDLATDGRTR